MDMRRTEVWAVSVTPQETTRGAPEQRDAVPETYPGRFEWAMKNGSATHPADEDHWLYKVYDHEGELLYVGVTKTGLQRLAQHKGTRDKAWTKTIARIEIEHYESRSDAYAAERRRIHELNPLHNVVHNDGRGPDVFRDAIEGRA